MRNNIKKNVHTNSKGFWKVGRLFVVLNLKYREYQFPTTSYSLIDTQGRIYPIPTRALITLCAMENQHNGRPYVTRSRYYHWDGERYILDEDNLDMIDDDISYRGYIDWIRSKTYERQLRALHKEHPDDERFESMVYYYNNI